MKNNQPGQSGNIFADIQGEVSAESAPLLQFITRYAGWIAGFVILLLVILGGMGIWNWYTNKKLQEAQNEIARISTQLKDKEKTAALEKLALSAPENVKMFILLSLGQAALENGDIPLAAKAYAEAAGMEKSTALGMTAALGNAGTLLMQDKYTEALALLQSLGQTIPQLNQKTPYLQMLAEAAAKAGETTVAAQAYENLAKLVDPQEAAYFRDRINRLQQKAK